MVSDPWTTSKTALRVPRHHVLGTIAIVSVSSSVGVSAQTWRDLHAPGASVAIVAVAALLELLLQSRADRPKRRWVEIALFVAVAFILVRPATSFSSVSLTVACVFIGHVALVGRLPGLTGRTRPAQPSVIVLPFVIAAQTAWFHLAPRILTAALVAIAGTVTIVLDRRPALSGRIHGLMRRSTTALVTVVAAPAVFIAATLTLYLPGALLHLGRRLLPRDVPDANGGSWRLNRTAIADQRRDAPHPYASTDRTVARSRNVAGTVITVALLALSITAIRRANQPAGGPDPGAVTSATPNATAAGPSGTKTATAKSILALEFATPYSSLPAFDGIRWANELQTEQASDQRNIRSRFHNVVNGDRRTLSPTPCPCKRADVWLTGGSAAFGIGQRDDQTIASFLVKLAAAEGISLDLQNISRDGAATSDELAGLKRRLTSEPAPDLVIFFDGWNDVLYVVASTFAHFNGADRSIAKNDGLALIENLNDHAEEFLRSGIGPEAGDLAANLYLKNAEVADRVLTERGVRAIHVFQPDALASTRQMAGYEKITGISPAEFQASPLSIALQRTTATLGDRVLNLRPLFDHYPQPVFAGLVHQNEAGAALTARRVFDEILPTLRKVAR